MPDIFGRRDVLDDLNDPTSVLTTTSSSSSSTAAPPKKPPPPPKPEETPAEAAAKTRTIAEGKFPASGAAGPGEHWSNISPPPFQPLPPPPQPEKTSVQEAWGSLAMVAAAIGGAMTRTHATTALNAAAAVMQGFHDKDLEKSKDALDRWRVANQNLLASQNYQMEIYKAILSGQKADILTNLAIAKEVRLQKAADLHAASAALHDNIMQEKLEKGDYEGAVKIIQAREKVYLESLKAAGQADAAADFLQALNELHQSPEYTSGSMLEKTGMELDVLKQFMPDGDNRGDGSAKDQRAALSVYNSLYPEDPATKKRPDGAPDLEDWYRNTWPSWGGKHMAAQQRKNLDKVQSIVDPKTGKVLVYKGTGDKTDPKNWVEQTPPPADAAPPPAAPPGEHPNED